MRKITTVLSIMILITLFSGKISAQGFSVGGGVYYATSLNNIGISLNGNYEVNKKIQIAPSFIYFLTKGYLSWKAFDVDGHYKFSSNNGLSIYGIGGIALTMVSFDLPQNEYWGGSSYTDTNFGINIGIGASKQMGTNLEAFGETKYTLNSGGFLKIGIGVLYRL